MSKDPISDAVQMLHAHTLRGILTYCNTNLCTLVTRDELARTWKQLGSGVDLDQVLQLLTSEELAARRLPCTAIVVDAGTERPWTGFFDVLRAHGIEISDEAADWQGILSELGVVPHTMAELYQARPRAKLPARHPLRRKSPTGSG
jgi:hypothetical protein